MQSPLRHRILQSRRPRLVGVRHQGPAVHTRGTADRHTHTVFVKQHRVARAGAAQIHQDGLSTIQPNHIGAALALHRHAVRRRLADRGQVNALAQLAHKITRLGFGLGQAFVF